MITALLHAEEVSVAPGDHASITLDLVNTGAESVLPVLRVNGAPPGVVATPQLTTPLQPGETRRTEIGFVVPTTFSSGRHRLSLQVGVGGPGADVTHHRFSLDVLPLDDVALSITPASPRGRLRGRFDVVLHNRSKSTKVLDLSAISDDVTVRFKPAQVRVRAGERTTTRGTVRARPVLFRSDSRRPFTIEARAQSRPLRSGGVFTQRPLVGALPRRGALVLAMVAFAVVGVLGTLEWLRGQRDGEVVSDQVAETSDQNTVDADGNGGADGGSGGGGEEGDDGDSEAGPGNTTLVGGEVELADELPPEGVTITIRPVSLDDPRIANVNVVGPERDRSRTKNVGFILQNIRAQQSSIFPFDVITDTTGTWELDGLVVGAHYEIKFAKAGYDSQAFIVSPSEPDSPIEVPVSLEPGAGRLAGVVRSGDPGIGGATVTITDGSITYQATTSSEPGRIGSWSIDGIGTPARYTISITADGYATEVRSVDLGPGGARTDLVSVLSSGTGSVTGVILTPSGDPGELDGVSVSLTGDGVDLSATPLTEGEVGRFLFSDLPLSQTYALEVSGDGWQTQVRDVVVEGGFDAGDISLTRSTAVITGTIRSADNTYERADADSCPTIDDYEFPAINGVAIRLESEELSLSTTSACDGAFTFPSVPPGDYQIRFEQFDHETLILPRTVGAGQTLIVSPGTDDEPFVNQPRMVRDLFNYVPGDLVLAGTVTNLEFAPVTGATVTITGVDREGTAVVQSDTTDGDGGYRVTGLDYGVWQVRVAADRFQTRDVIVNLATDEPEDEDIALVPLGSFEGRVIANANGDGLNGATVRVINGPTGAPAVPAVLSATSAGITGSWAISQLLAPGTWDVQAVLTGYLTQTQPDIVASDVGDPTTVDDFALIPRPALDVNVATPIIDGCGSEPCFADVTDATVTLLAVPTGYTGSLTSTSASATVTFEEPIGGTTADDHPMVPGSYTIEVAADGYETVTGVVVNVDTDPASATAERTSITVALFPSDTEPGETVDRVGGTIVGPFNGIDGPVVTQTLVTGDVVSAFNPILDDDAEPVVTPIVDRPFIGGSWTIPEHRYGTTDYVFENDDYADETVEVAVGADDAVEYDNDIEVALRPLPSSIFGALAITPPPSTYVDFTVTMSADTGFVSDVTVPLANGTGIAAGTGVFDVTGLAPGSWTVTFTDTNGGDTYVLPSPTPVRLEPNVDNDLGTLNGTENADLTLIIASSERASARIEDRVGNIVRTTVADTDDDGSITFTNLDPGVDYFAVVSALRHETTSFDIDALAFGENRDENLDLPEWGRATGALSGVIGLVTRVTSPLELADVTLTDTTSGATYSGLTSNVDNEEGTFSVQAPAGEYLVSFDAPNYNGSTPTPAPTPFTISNDVSLGIGSYTIPVIPVDVDFLVRSAVDGTSPNPLLNTATITLSSTAETDPPPQSPPGGTATFAALQPIFWDVTISAPGHLTTTYQLEVTPGGVVTQDITLFQTVGSLSGTVTAQINVGGTTNIGPVAGVAVGTSGGIGTATTDASGVYLISNVVNQEYEDVPYDAEPLASPNVLYDEFTAASILVLTPPGALTRDVALTPKNGTITATITPTDANDDLALTALRAQLRLVNLSTGGVTNFGSAGDVAADGSVGWTNVPPSRPHNLTSPLYQWEIFVTDNTTGGYADVTSSRFNLDPAGSAAPGIPITSVPAAPTGLTLTAALGGFGASWTGVDGADDGGSDITSYTVEWTPTTGGGSQSTSDGTTTSLGVAGLTAGTEYTVTVRANNGVGAGAASTAGTVTAPDRPDAPTDFTISVGASPGDLDASWTDPPDNGLPLDRYQFGSKLTSASTWTTVDPATSPQQLTGLTVGSSYDFRVRVRNDVGWSSYSTASFTTVGTPSAPTDLTTQELDEELRISWTAPTGADTAGSAITDYEVTVTDGVTPVVQATGSAATSISISGLTNSTEYTITVRARNSDFWSVASSSITGEPLGRPSSPRNFSLRNETTVGFDIRWRRPSDDGGTGSETLTYEYRIDNGSWVLLTEDPMGNTNADHPVTGLDSDTTYSVELRVSNAGDEAPRVVSDTVTTRED